MSKIDVAYYFADVMLPDEIEIFANEAGRQGIENLVDGEVEWDDFAIEALGWLGTDASEIPGIPFDGPTASPIGPTTSAL